MTSWIANPITDVLRYQSNSGLLPEFLQRKQTSTGIEPPAPQVATVKFDEKSFIDGGELLGLLFMVTIAAAWWLFRKRQ